MSSSAEGLTKITELVKEWRREVVIFKMREKSFMNSMDNLTRLNEQIYNLCESEGIDINKIGLILK